MNETVHIVPVGHTVETLVESIRRFPVSKVVFVLGGRHRSGTERKARETAAAARRSLGVLEYGEIVCDLDDVVACAGEIIKYIVHEKEKKNTVYVNLSGGLRSAGIAAYMAAQYTCCEAYAGQPAYSGEGVTGIRGMVQIPSLPIKEISEDRLEILEFLLGKGSVAFEELIKTAVAKGKSKDSESSRLSYHVKELEEDGLLERDKKGRKTYLKITSSGSLYVRGRKGCE